MTTPKAQYDHVTSLGIATKAMTAGEFDKLPLKTIPFSPLPKLSPASVLDRKRELSSWSTFTL
jgi:hypothetical protein